MQCSVSCSVLPCYRVNENPSESGGSFDASGAFHGGGGYSDEDEVSNYLSCMMHGRTYQQQQTELICTSM